jgi:hypothetical protein
MDACPPDLPISGEARQGEMEDARILVQTQFGKRLILLSAVDAYDLIPPEGKDEEPEEPGARKGPMATQEAMDRQKRKDAMQLECRALEFCREVEMSSRRAENRRKARAQGTAP